MNRLFSALLVSLLTFSCSIKDDNTQNVNNADETPDILEGGESDINFSSLNKRYNTDIIQNLFAEAMDKDEHLKALSNRIVGIRNMKVDSLADYQKYKGNNQQYWSAVDNYLQQISDSTLSQELRGFMDNLEDKYTARIVGHESETSKIITNESTLRNQEIVMKLLVTVPMMSNYQRNELPDINVLKSVNMGYDSLIQDVKPYTELKK
jgi:CHAT domain-containing protein